MRMPASPSRPHPAASRTSISPPISLPKRAPLALPRSPTPPSAPMPSPPASSPIAAPPTRARAPAGRSPSSASLSQKLRMQPMGRCRYKNDSIKQRLKLEGPPPDQLRQDPPMKLVTGNSNRALAQAVASYLELPLTDCTVKRFADKEVYVEIHENVRGEDVFVLQSTSFPANDNLMELLIAVDALRRASAKRITAVLPYFGYARQDRKPGPRTPISAKLVANLITEAGAHRVLSVDLHAGQIQGFFDIPTDNLFAAPVMATDIHARFSKHDLTVNSPD